LQRSRPTVHHKMPAPSKRARYTNALHECTAGKDTRPKLRAHEADWRTFMADGQIRFCVDPELEAVLRTGGYSSSANLAGAELVWRTEISTPHTKHVAVTATEIKVFALIKIDDKLLKQRVRVGDHQAFMERLAMASPTKRATQRRPSFLVRASSTADADACATNPSQRSVLMRLYDNDNRADQLHTVASLLDEQPMLREAVLHARARHFLALNLSLLPLKRPEALSAAVIAARPLLPRRRPVGGARLASLEDPAFGARDATEADDLAAAVASAPLETKPAAFLKSAFICSPAAAKGLYIAPSISLSPEIDLSPGVTVEDGGRRAPSMRALHRD